MMRGLLIREGILTKEECIVVKEWILKHETKVSSTRPIHTHSGTVFNPLDLNVAKIYGYDCTVVSDILVPKLRKLCKELELKFPVSVQCWGNTFKKGEGIKEHQHSYGGTDVFMCANIFISGPKDIGVWYKDKETDQLEKIIGEPGDMTLFFEDHRHWVDTNETDEVRISLAFNIWPGGEIGSDGQLGAPSSVAHVLIEDTDPVK